MGCTSSVPNEILEGKGGAIVKEESNTDQNPNLENHTHEIFPLISQDVGGINDELSKSKQSNDNTDNLETTKNEIENIGCDDISSSEKIEITMPEVHTVDENNLLPCESITRISDEKEESINVDTPIDDEKSIPDRNNDSLTSVELIEDTLNHFDDSEAHTMQLEFEELEVSDPFIPLNPVNFSILVRDSAGNEHPLQTIHPTNPTVFPSSNRSSPTPAIIDDQLLISPSADHPSDWSSPIIPTCSPIVEDPLLTTPSVIPSSNLSSPIMIDDPLLTTPSVVPSSNRSSPIMMDDPFLTTPSSNPANLVIITIPPTLEVEGKVS